MGKSSIELTLKQLIDLGIINLKKRKRKRKGKRVKQYLPNNIKSDSSGMVGYSTPITDASKSFYQYSDPLRLRDEQDRLRIKQLEQDIQNKNVIDFTNQKMLENQNILRDYYNKREIQNEPFIEEPDEDLPQKGFTEDDGLGIMGASATDDMFVPQINRQPNQGGFADIDEETFGLSPEAVAKEQTPLANLSEEEFEVEQPAQVGFAEEEDPPIKIVNQQGFALPQMILKEGGIPKQSPRKGRPTKEPLRYYQNRYEEILGDQVDPQILSSRRVKDIEPTLVELLLSEYISLGGANKQILKSKNAKLIDDELKLLKDLFKS
jgi:hypothetical protein